MGVQPMACGPHAAQSNYQHGPGGECRVKEISIVQLDNYQHSHALLDMLYISLFVHSSPTVIWENSWIEFVCFCQFSKKIKKTKWLLISVTVILSLVLT